jgi:hypothetical protein
MRANSVSRCARVARTNIASRIHEMTIHWYPGHMHKAQKDMIELLPQVDLLIEILDARIPYSSENPAIARVAERVRQGGHDIPEAVIRRRFAAGLSNFTRYYLAAVDDWVLYDNAGSSPVLLDWGENS